MSKKTGKGRPVLPQLLCGLALCFTALIFAPVEMVTLNNINFWFGVKDFLPLFIGLFLAALAAVELVYLGLRKLPYSLWLLSLALLFGVTLCVYVQGTYLCMGSEALISGEPVWREMRREMLLNAAVWAAILLGSVALSLTKPKLFLRIVPAVSALILVMEGAALVSLMSGSCYNSDINHIYCSDEEQFTFSDNGDVIMIMLDTFDTRYLDRALVEDPDYADVFEDFTYYRNTSSSTMLTDSSFASFMTGQVPDNSEPFFIYCRRAFKESRFFPIMKDTGMTVQAYGAPIGMFSVDQMKQVDNLRERKSHISDPVAFIKKMLCMLGYRYLPMLTQPFMLEDYTRDFAELQEMDDGPAESTNNNPAFIRKLNADGVTVDQSRRFYKFFLLHGAHEPTQMNRYMEEMEGATRYEQLMGCFAMLEELFAQLKEKGVYDKATIIVFGDHGINDDWRNGICNPVMLVKYPGEKGPMRTSMAPTALLDMRATALYGAGIAHEELGMPVHEWEGVGHRDRTMLTYRYEVPNSYTFYLRWMYEFIVPDDATDLEGYVHTGRVLKPQ